MTHWQMGARAVANLVHHRDWAVTQSHDAVSLLGEDFPSFPSFAAKHDWEASIQQLQLVLDEHTGAAAVLSCSSKAQPQ